MLTDNEHAKEADNARLEAQVRTASVLADLAVHRLLGDLSGQRVAH